MATYNHVKLEELARAQNIAAPPPPKKLCQLTSLDVPSFITSDSENRAEQLLRANKLSGLKRTATILKSGGSAIHTIVAVLPRLVESNESAGVVQALLNRGQPSSPKESDKIQSQLRNWDDLLLKAATASNADLVWLLAPRTSLQGRNEALAAALTIREPNTIRKLLEYNANPNFCSHQFLDAAEKADHFIINDLISAPTQIEQRVLVEALVPAVKSGCLRTLQLIVSTVNWEGLQDVRAITEAVTRGQVGAVLTIFLSAKDVRSADLDELVLNVFNDSAVNPDSLATILHALFYAGAAGPRCSAAMRNAVEKKSSDFVQLFAEHGVDINWSSGVIVKRAVETGRSDLLHMILTSGSLSIDNASAAVKALRHNLPSEDRFDLLDILIGAGAHGENLEEELKSAAEKNERELVVFLRSKGVSVDTNQGQALIAAIQNENVDILRSLLQGPVAQLSLQTALPYVRFTGKLARSLLTKLLVRAKVEGETVDKSLQDAVCDDSLDHDEELIGVLLQAGGSPMYDDSKSIRHTIMHEDFVLFEKLLNSPAGVSEGVISSLIPEVLNVRDRDARLSMIGCSLTKSPKGNSVAAALLTVVKEDRIDMRLLKLIVERGQVDINYRNGIILAESACVGIPVLKELMRINDRSRDTTTAALVKLLGLETYDDEAKAATAAILLASGRISDAATQGMISYVEFLKASNMQGENWPTKTFETLLRAGAEINSCKTLLPDVARAAAIRLLKMLLMQQPNVALLDSALAEAVRLKRGSRADVVQLILGAGPSHDSISSALIQASCTNLDDTCSMLLKYGPSLSFDNFAAIRYAAKSGNTNLLKTFLDIKPSREAIDASFEEAKTILDVRQKFKAIQAILVVGVRRELLDEYLIDQVRRGSQQDMIQMLLNYQADVHYQRNQSLVLASLHGNLEILQMLFAKAMNRSSAATQCFDELIRKDLVQQDRVVVLTFLLDTGARGSSLNIALRQTVRDLPGQPGLLPLLEALFSHGADVNHDQGHALCYACEKTGPEVVAIFIKWRPSVKVRSRAMHFLLGSAVSESGFCRVIDLLMDTGTSSQGRPEFCSSQEGFVDPLKVLLCKRPDGVVELGQVLKHQPQILSQPANKDILSWAMTQSNIFISNKCLALLISNGANVNHRNPRNGESVLLQTIKCKRSELVGAILAHGADITVFDQNGVSPLLLASMNGDQVAAANLLKVGAPKNDGSLHHAVREFKSRVVELLLKHGHDPNYPSPQCQGRSPLAEMLYNGKAGRQDHSNVENVIHLMVEYGADTRRLVSRKPLVCWALDNIHDPIYMVQPLMSAYLYKEIDADYNLYNNGRYIYSPTMYVAKREFTGLADRADDLVVLLRNSGANRDVYYSLNGVQPEDAQGLPKELAEIELVRRAKLAMRKEEEEDVARRRRLDDEEFEREKKRDEERFQQSMERRQFLEKEDVRIQKDKNKLAIALNSNIEAAKQREMTNQHRLQMQMSEEIANREQQAYLENSNREQRQREKEFHHRTALSELEMKTTRERLLLEDGSHRQRTITAQSAIEAQAKVQKELMSSQDHHDQKAHKRKLEQFAMAKAIPVGMSTVTPVGYIEN